MSALWTALYERSHEGLVEDYIKLMESREAALAAAEAKGRVEGLKEALLATTFESREAIRRNIEQRIVAIEKGAADANK